jgi:DNA-binding MarR family transcriptional regulator
VKRSDKTHLKEVLDQAARARVLFPRAKRPEAGGGPTTIDQLDATTLQVLLALTEQAEHTTPALAQRLAIGQGTVATVLTRLEEAGLITQVVAADARYRSRQLTPAGEQIVQRFAARLTRESQ